MSFPFTVPLSPKEVITPTSTKRAPLGTRGATADGRIFRYARAGATALVKGYCCQSEVGATQWANATACWLSTAWFTEIGTTYIPAGTNYLHLSSTMDSDLSVTANDFADGWVWDSGTSTGAGQAMRIKSHTVGVSGSTGFGATGGQVLMYFEDGYQLSEPIDTAHEISFAKNEYDDVIVVPTTMTGELVGVPPVNVPASYYFWIQTWGPCAVRAEAEAIVSGGKEVMNSTQTAGAVQGVTSTTDGPRASASTGEFVIVGKMVSSSGLVNIQANTNVLVHLTLAP